MEEWGRKGEEKKKKINQFHLHLLLPLVDLKAGRRYKMATEALPAREQSPSCARGPNKLS